MYKSQPGAPYVGSHGGLRETPGVADRPRDRGAFVGKRVGSNGMRYLTIR
jgi:hypothetical protein